MLAVEPQTPVIVELANAVLLLLVVILEKHVNLVLANVGRLLLALAKLLERSAMRQTMFANVLQRWMLVLGQRIPVTVVLANVEQLLHAVIQEKLVNLVHVSVELQQLVLARQQLLFATRPIIFVNVLLLLRLVVVEKNVLVEHVSVSGILYIENI